MQATLEHDIPWLSRKNRYSNVPIRYKYAHIEVKLRAFGSGTIYATSVTLLRLAEMLQTPITLLYSVQWQNGLLQLKDISL